MSKTAIIITLVVIAILIIPNLPYLLPKKLREKVIPKPRKAIQCLACGEIGLEGNTCCGSPIHMVTQDRVEY